jgi:hypothetical protein
VTAQLSNSQPLGILINPVSGRDVRRLAARAGTSTPEDKRNQVQRVIIGAAAAGAERVIMTTDPFRIAQSAAAALGVPIDVELLDLGGRCDPGDTAAAARTMRDRGCGAIVVLGGDGTNRQVAKVWPDAPLVPMSTGTNNVFPSMVEATTAGAAAGLVAAGRIDLARVSQRAKVVTIEIDGEPDDLALIDAVHIVDDNIGNRMPYEPANMRRIVLSRAEPAAVGISPIGGLLHPTGQQDERGVDVECAPLGHHNGLPLRVPISPGLYAEIGIVRSRELPLGEAVEVVGPGLLAYDGDRERELAPGQVARLRVERVGPRVIDVTLALTHAAANGSFRDGRHWHDNRMSGGVACC